MKDFEPNDDLEEFIDGLSVKELIAFAQGLECGAASLAAVALQIVDRAKAKVLEEMAAEAEGLGDVC